MTFPGLGELAWDEESWWFVSPPVDVAVLGRRCRFILNGYVDDPEPADFHAAVRAFLALGPRDAPVLDDPGVRPGGEILVQREDAHVDVVLECEWDGDPEHGLEVVFRDGTTVTKVGPYGH